MSDSKVEQQEMEIMEEDIQEQLEAGSVEESSQLAARASSDQELDEVHAADEADEVATLDEDEANDDYPQPPVPNLLEAAIFASAEPVSIERLLTLFPPNLRPAKAEIRDELLALQAAWRDRGVQLIEVATGWRFQTPAIYAPWIQRFQQKKPPKFSRAMLETLALIIYKQPITRGEIEEVRGVAVSSHMVKHLLDRQWIKVVGHRDVPGRPALFSTTKTFLNDFNLQSLDEMPALAEIANLEQVEKQMQQKLQQELELPVASISVAAQEDSSESEHEAEPASQQAEIYGDTSQEELPAECVADDVDMLEDPAYEEDNLER